MAEPVAVVRSLLDHLVVLDIDAAVDLLDVEVEWRNTGLPALRGPKVAETLRSMKRAGIGFDYEMHSAAADGDTVLTDRHDVLGKGRWSSRFWVRGTFVVRDGKVRLWDDRYSLADVARGSVVGLARVVLPRR